MSQSAISRPDFVNGCAGDGATHLECQPFDVAGIFPHQRRLEKIADDVVGGGGILAAPDGRAGNLAQSDMPSSVWTFRDQEGRFEVGAEAAPNLEFRPDGNTYRNRFNRSDPHSQDPVLARRRRGGSCPSISSLARAVLALDFVGASAMTSSTVVRHDDDAIEIRKDKVSRISRALRHTRPERCTR